MYFSIKDLDIKRFNCVVVVIEAVDNLISPDVSVRSHSAKVRSLRATGLEVASPVCSLPFSALHPLYILCKVKFGTKTTGRLD